MNQLNRCTHRLGRVLIASLLTMLYQAPAEAELNSKQRLRAFAQLPDWSGIWEVDSDILFETVTAPSAKDIKFFQTLHSPPYNAEWQARFQAENPPPDKTACIFGFPNVMESLLQFQTIVTPEETTLIFAARELRHVFTDGRGHPAAKDLWPTPWGDSIGHWEGQTLVIDTVASNSKMMVANFVNDNFELAIASLSPQVRFTERLRMLGKDRLENQITIDDPIAFVHPWTYTVTYRRAVDYDRLIDDECLGNERNPVVDGKFTVTPP